MREQITGTRSSSDNGPEDRARFSDIVQAQDPQENYYSVRIVNLIHDGPVSDPGHPIAPDGSSRVVPVMFRVRGEPGDPSVDSFCKDGISTDDLVEVVFEDLLCFDAVVAQSLRPVPYDRLFCLGLSDKFRDLARAREALMFLLEGP